jgi:LuxR family transcriptional regulator, maltose regulon positive regulatory protein
MTAPEVKPGTALAAADSKPMLPVQRHPAETARARPTPGHLAGRMGLVDRVRRAAFPILVVDAPAGYGKTTWLRQWAATESRPVQWIALTEAHNDPAGLLTCILGALNATAPLEEHLDAGPVNDPAFLVGVVLPRLRRVLQMRAQPVVIVLDGTEALHAPHAWTVLSAFLEATSGETCFVLAGRRQPPLPLGRWVTHRRLLWLRRADLLLSPAESMALLVEAGVPGTPEVLDPLIDRCAGWPAGLTIAAEFVLGARDVEEAAHAFSGGSGAMRDYLRRTMLDALPVSVRRFLAASSVLSELTGERCDAVLGMTGSGLQLVELSRSNLLVDAVDEHSDRFRCHPLLRDLLRGDLRMRDPQREQALHHRASQSYEQVGAVEQALGHAKAAGDSVHAAELVWSHVAEQRAADDRPLERWLDTFSTAELQDSPRLALASAWRAFETGRPLDHWLSAASRSSVPGPHGRPDPSVRAGLALFRAVLAKDGIDGMSVDADLAVEQSGDDAWRCMACHLAGVARLLLGDRAGASRWFTEGQQLSRLLDVPSVEAQCTAYQAVMALEDEEWASAAALTDRALELIERFGLQNDVTMMTAYVAAAASSARRGDRSASEQATRKARHLLARTPPGFAPWMRTEVRLLLARAHLLLGDPRSAGSMLDEADAVMRSTAIWTAEFGRKLLHARRMVDDLPVTTAVGPAGITIAELRVLQLLPTHLSFQEIGDSVYLSRNTVKTQAIAAYRKLGVNSRAEAVACARTLGLLDQ